jgi:dTDP-4-amino-4,6-dideoxygalactose transaminase
VGVGIGNALIGDLEQLMVTRAVRRQSLFRMWGPNSECWRAEDELQQMYSGRRCLLLPSATVVLSLLLELLDFDRGREILISPFGWISNWSCVQRAGLRVRYLPLDEDLQLQPAAVAERITDRTAAVIVTHLMGRGQQGVQEIAEICRARDVPLLEDVAQSFGVSVRGRRAGTFGLAAWCSLNHHKVISAGDGGFAVVRDPALFARLSALHDQGCVVVDGDRHPHPELEPGLSLRVSELMAAVLRAQLARYHLIRARILRLYDALARACSAELGLELLPASDGDLPFTLLFRRPPSAAYPSLMDSNWHVASEVSWLGEEFLRSARRDESLDATLENLRSVSALGAGFIDPYLAIPTGLKLTDRPEAATEVAQRLREEL